MCAVDFDAACVAGTSTDDGIVGDDHADSIGAAISRDLAAADAGITVITGQIVTFDDRADAIRADPIDAGAANRVVIDHHRHMVDRLYAIGLLCRSASANNRVVGGPG